MAIRQHRRHRAERKRKASLPSLKALLSFNLLAALKSWAPEREIFLRTGGKVRFLRVSSPLQLVAIALTLFLFGSWGVATGVMLWDQSHIGAERAALATQQSIISGREAHVKAYRQSVDEIADDIVARQKALEAMMRAGLGVEPDAVAPTDQSADKTGATSLPSGKVSDSSGAATNLLPEQRFQSLRARQLAFETQLADATRARITKVEQAIRGFGLNPAAFSRSRVARGGPFIPVSSLIATDAGLRELAALMGRLNAMETTLATIPSGRPTAAPMQSSSYGFRRDPFNGLMAFHAGIDFPGRYGQPIVAASDGRVSYVGGRPGYGKVVEIDHGNGIMTRYAHLSRFGAQVGDKVTRGQAIARMGSTGRSTGTHLHFEVRVRGAAVNPRRFLEARQDVLEVQKLTKHRLVRGDRS